MKNTINTYFAILLITIAGAGATMLIVNIATTDVIASALNRSGSDYEELRRSILESQGR